MAADKQKQLRGTPARPADRRDPLCPICGDHPLDCESVVQLVRLVHTLQLRDELVLTTDMAPDPADALVARGEEAGPEFLMSGASALRTNIAIAVSRLLKAFRERRVHRTGERLYVIVGTRDELRDALEEALDRGA